MRTVQTFLTALLALAVPAIAAEDPLPSWNDGLAKSSITAFVENVTNDGSPDFIPAARRIATFDNDGCLWSEQPAYFQLLFAIDRVKAMAAHHPEWREQEPFKSVLAGDMKAAAASGMEGVEQLVAATHAGMTIQEYDAVVRDWLANAVHPKTGKRYTQMVYQPMLEVLAYLRANGFKTYIVSGGGVEFIRAFAEQTYGIPPEQVVGSRGTMQLESRAGKPVLVKLPEIDLVDDGPGKPIGIQQSIGRRPVMAFGNSDGDLQMLQYVMAGDGPRFALIVHHTDADREFAYDRDSPFGRLDKALDEGKAKGWTVVDMKEDWSKVYPDRQEKEGAVARPAGRPLPMPRLNEK